MRFVQRFPKCFVIYLKFALIPNIYRENPAFNILAPHTDHFAI
jgi:hypothetical protein